MITTTQRPICSGLATSSGSVDLTGERREPVEPVEVDRTLDRAGVVGQVLEMARERVHHLRVVVEKARAAADTTCSPSARALSGSTAASRGARISDSPGELVDRHVRVAHLPLQLLRLFDDALAAFLVRRIENRPRRCASRCSGCRRE